MKDARWTNGKRTINGRWAYHWPSDSFTIELDVRDVITGAKTRTFTVKDDTPEWGKFRLIREAA